jgi:hypothetical protein
VIYGKIMYPWYPAYFLGKSETLKNGEYKSMMQRTEKSVGDFAGVKRRFNYVSGVVRGNHHDIP